MTDRCRKALPNVLFVANDLHVGGTQRQIVELAKGLYTSGQFNVTIAIMEAGGEFEEVVAPFIDRLVMLDRGGRIDARPLFKLMTVAKRSRTDLIQGYDWISVAMGLVCAGVLGVPFLHGGIRSGMPALPWQERLSSRLARLSDAVVANSKVGVRSYGLGGDPRVKVIPNGVDLQRFCNVTPLIRPRPTVCMVANFSRFKDHKTVLRSAALLKSRGKEMLYLLIGHDHGTLGELRRFCREAGLESCVHFITGVTDTAPYVAGSDVCVLASSAGEGISNVLLEYMALGKPVVATLWPGNAEVIEDGQTGFLVAPFAPEPMADQVLNLVEDGALASTIGYAAQRQVRRSFSLERMVHAYESMYAALLGRRIGPLGSCIGL